MYFRTLKILLFVLALLILSTDCVSASLIKINKNGEIIENVLSYQEGLTVAQNGEMVVTSINNNSVSSESQIHVSKEGENMSLSYNGKNLDVTNWNQDLIEVEERGSVSKITVGLSGGRFTVAQNGYLALTDYAITVDAPKNRFSLSTPSGEKYLAVLPYDAVLGVKRARIITNIADNRMQIIEDSGDVVYDISGERVVNFFNLYKMNVPVSAKVSVSTGEICAVSQPFWLKLVDYILV